jgi:hypothetical protein
MVKQLIREAIDKRDNKRFKRLIYIVGDHGDEQKKTNKNI